MTDLSLTEASGNSWSLTTSGSANVIDYGQCHYWWPQPTYVPWPVYLPCHRACTCPNCRGDCCSCADCKIKRLEKRLADLEAKR